MFRNQADRLPQATRQRLEEFQRRVRSVKIAEGLLAGLFGLALSYVVVFTLDRFFDTPALLRGGLLIGGSVGLAILFPLKCHRWVWGTRQMEQVATLLKHKLPALGDQLLGVVELAKNASDLGSSETLAQAAIRHVDSLVKDRDFSDAVPRPRHRVWARTAAIPVVLMLLALVIVPAAGRNAAKRWLMPWSNIDRYTFAQIDQLPDHVIVPHGESFSLKASLADSSEWSPASGTATVGGQQSVTAQRNDKQYEFAIPPQTSSSEVNLRIGDLQDSVAVKTATRPELTGMKASVTLPGYLQYSKPLDVDARGGSISVVKGSVAAIEAEVSRGVLSASVETAGVAATESSAIPTEVAVSLPDAQATVTGNRIRTNGIPVQQSSTLSFRWKDELGLAPRDAFPLKINALEDTEPVVSCLQNDPQQVILSTDVVTFELSANDDFGVREIGLEWSGVGDDPETADLDVGGKVVSAGAPESTQLKATATFSAQSDQVNPQTLQLRAYANDYKTDRGRVYSPVYVLHVLSPADHAIWMSEQLRRWASRADDVYEEEMRLHVANRELRMLTAEQLGQQEVQQQLEQQVAAEKANTNRLTGITQQGQTLINQALRNPEMLVGHLETWAAALKQLEAIAGQRMPSVAALLQDAASKNADRMQKQAAAGAGGKPAAAKPGPKVGNNRGSAPAASDDKAPAEDENQEKPPESQPVPKIEDIESGFNKPNEASKDEDKDAEKKKKGGKAKFTLPETVLQGGPPPKPKSDKPQPEEDAPEQPLDNAVEEQEDLLAEFEKVREDLQKIMEDLDNSTFVKRFKSASRQQMEVSGDLNRTLLKSFGVERSRFDERQVDQSERIAVREERQSEYVRTIQSDLEAYTGRKPDEKYQRIVDEMKQLDVVVKLNELSGRVRGNLSGEAISRAEYWADTLDRWGEELVAVSEAGQCKGGGKSASLPPSIVLEVMRILAGEIALREETRSLDQARSALELAAYTDRAQQQAATQTDLHKRTLQVIDDIRLIPEGDEKFAKELEIIGSAGTVMQDVVTILKHPETGPTAVAAESEVIELLLQAKRANPKGGGGAGGPSPGQGGDGTTDQAALALFGPGSDAKAKVEDRGVQQATGLQDSQLPEEFREGLDAFFNAVEGAK